MAPFPDWSTSFEVVMLRYSTRVAGLLLSLLAVGTAFGNALIEQYGGNSEHALSIFAAIESAMTEARGFEDQSPVSDATDKLRQAQREAFMRISIRQALKNHMGNIAVVCGAWHLSGLRAPAKASDDRALIKDLPKIKIELVLPDSVVHSAVAGIIKAAKTGRIGDGKVFVLRIDEAVRVRTAETGEKVV